VRIRKLPYCSRLGLVSDYPVVPLPEGGIEIMVGDLVSKEQRILVLALEVLPIPPLADGRSAASIEGEALLEIELAYDEITEAGITSKTEQRTIRLVAVQDPADVRVNAQVLCPPTRRSDREVPAASADHLGLARALPTEQLDKPPTAAAPARYAV
jgi:hypothetical protein